MFEKGTKNTKDQVKVRRGDDIFFYCLRERRRFEVGTDKPDRHLHIDFHNALILELQANFVNTTTPATRGRQGCRVLKYRTTPNRKPGKFGSLFEKFLSFIFTTIGPVSVSLIGQRYHYLMISCIR